MIDIVHYVLKEMTRAYMHDECFRSQSQRERSELSQTEESLTGSGTLVPDADCGIGGQ